MHRRYLRTCRVECERNVTGFPKKPIVSVIIPTYNRAHLIAGAIESVLDQTYQNFEIIIVDDSSTDKTEELIKEFIYLDSRVKYFKHDRNKGGSASRNTGIINARGNFLAFLDSDDIWLPHKIEKQLRIFYQNGPELGAVGSGSIALSGNKMKNFIPTGKFGNIYKNLLTSLDKDWPGETSTIMIKHECIEKVGLFDELLESSQEHDLYIRISKHYHFDVVREPLVKFFRPKNSITLNLVAKLNGRRRMIEKYEKDMPKICKLKSSYSSTAGKILCQQKKMKEGRFYLLKALLSYPMSLTNWFVFFLSLLPFPFFKFFHFVNSKLKTIMINWHWLPSKE
ncbi:MAG TPA: glycosyltransferase family 2 protein [Desulfobacterales bacterium]|nr:glycosyltransferase family 2 protein [Desulfobacterales bacterium]